MEVLFCRGTSDIDIPRFIGKYLSRLRKLDDVITPKEGFET
jgi:hypothetical protein